MLKHYRLLFPLCLIVCGLGFVAGDIVQFTRVAEAQSSNRVFELRTYTAHPGRLDDLAMLQDWMADNTHHESAPLSENTLIYVLAHDSRAAAEASWAAFRDDPEQQRLFEASRSDGPLVESVVSVFMDPTHYSQMM